MTKCNSNTPCPVAARRARRRLEKFSLLVTTAGVLIALSPAAIAKSNEVDKPIQLTQACEEALAKSALPERLRERASVYVWQKNKFQKTKSADGGLHCYLERNHPQSIIPLCFSENGVDSMIPAASYKTSLAMKGMKPSEAAKLYDAKVEAGDFMAPSAPGITYMMSELNFIYNEQTDIVRKIPPHVMFFAPNITNQELGGSIPEAMSNKGFPGVIDSGIHGYIVTFVEKGASVSEVEQKCAGQLDQYVYSNARE